MSDPLRIGFVVEGPTDRIVLDAVAARLLGSQDFVTEQLSPELLESFAAQSGGGWGSVYSWCRQAAGQSGGSLRNNPVLDLLDVLIVQIDADVASRSYSDYSWIPISQNQPNDLPCRQPCPPASATTNPLRSVVLGWMGEIAPPPRTVLCTPSSSTDTWVLVALFPNNRVAADPAIECRANPEAQLQIQPLGRRLVRNGAKQPNKYKEAAGEITRQWHHVRQRCTEAERFSSDFLVALTPP